MIEQEPYVFPFWYHHELLEKSKVSGFQKLIHLDLVNEFLYLFELDVWLTNYIQQTYSKALVIHYQLLC